jgi:hypothetical protein
VVRLAVCGIKLLPNQAGASRTSGDKTIASVWIKLMLIKMCLKAWCLACHPSLLAQSVAFGISKL